MMHNPDGSTEGRDPRAQSLDDLGDFATPIKAIRAKCIDCSGGSPSEARKCTAIGCAPWPYRMDDCADGRECAEVASTGEWQLEAAS
jgi:hypothetical protein